MIRRTTWFLVAAFVIILGVALYLQRARPGAESEGTPTPSVTSLLDTQGQAISRLSISNAEGQRVSVERGPQDAWVLLEPAGQPADEARISSAVMQAESLRIVSNLETPPQPEVVGLEPPRYRLAVTLADGSEQVAFIGDPTPTESGYYAHLDQGPIVVVVKPALDSIIELVNTPPIMATSTLTGTLETTVTVTPEATGANAAEGTGEPTETGQP